MVHCRNCGNEMNSDATVCSKCGATVGSGNSQPGSWSSRNLIKIILLIIVLMVILQLGMLFIVKM